MIDHLPLIYNPTAGGHSQRKVKQAVELLTELGAPVRLMPTTCAGSATELARQAVAEGAARVLVAGGDGTLNEAINGLAGSGTELAVLPMGTANVLATEMEIPTGLEGACRLATQEGSVSVDLGKAGERYFALMAGIGFDALVIKNLNPILKKSIRRGAYPVSGILTMIQKDLPLLKISAAGRKSEGYFVVASNSRYYGGKFGPTPDASMVDGLLDICVLKGKSLPEMVNFWIGALKKARLDSSRADYFRANRVEVSCPSGEPIPVQTDGEVIDETPITLAVAPGALKICAGGQPH